MAHIDATIKASRSRDGLISVYAYEFMADDWLVGREKCVDTAKRAEEEAGTK